jgi:hypothetical protein
MALIRKVTLFGYVDEALDRNLCRLASFDIYQGNDLTVEISIKEYDLTEATIPDGCTIYWSLFPIGDGDALLERTMNDTDRDGNVFSFTLVPADTEELLGTYYHEARLVTDTGNIYTLFVGTANVCAARMS